MPRTWSKQVIWGNHRITGGVIRPNANAFQLGTTWGAALDRGDNRLGHVAQERWRQPVWGTADSLSEDNLVGHRSRPTATTWSGRPPGTTGTATATTTSSGAPTAAVATATTCVGNSIGDNLVWGTALSADNLCGTAALGDNPGAARRDNLVWGTSGDVDNLVWGTRATTTT